MTATLTARDELTGYLSSTLQPDDMIGFNAWLAARPELTAWLNVPTHRRVAILEAEAETAARAARNAGGPQ